MPHVQDAAPEYRFGTIFRAVFGSYTLTAQRESPDDGEELLGSDHLQMELHTFMLPHLI